jgi:hypothetical protein
MSMAGMAGFDAADAQRASTRKGHISAFLDNDFVPQLMDNFLVATAAATM